MNNSIIKRVLITGAGGFIGRHCLPILISNGFEVHAADVFVPEGKFDGFALAPGRFIGDEADVMNCLRLSVQLIFFTLLGMLNQVSIGIR